ncbi:MAG: efflux RND transporter permease subunit, partial [Sediminibacterium sp.]
MWHKLAEFIVKFKVYCLTFLLLITIVMGYFAAQVKLSYEFTKAIPDDNPKFVIYKDFVKKFGVDGTTIVIGFKTDQLYTTKVFNQLYELHQQIKQIPAVTDVLSIPFTYTILKDSLETKFNVQSVFSAPYQNDSVLMADAHKFESFPFYKNLLYNKDSNSYIMAVSFNSDSINTAARTRIIHLLEEKLNTFSTNTHLGIHLSGLPYIRTIIADRIKKEMLWFLIGSLFLSAITLLIFFR